MQWMHSVSHRMGFLLAVILLAGSGRSAHADLIRAAPGRSFPDIAGDIGGLQNYDYDPATRTGTFTLVNAPHLISLGPSVKDLIPLQPISDGTLYQSLKLILDRKGRLVNSPLNKFEIYGRVMINDVPFEGLLLAGIPTAFGIAEPDRPAVDTPDVFGLNMRIEGGYLAQTFGSEAYLRIIPQSKSTFTGEFNCNFSAERPMTNLLALDRRMASPFLERAAKVGLIPGVAALLAWPIVRALARGLRRRPAPPDRPLRRWASPA